MEPTLVMQGDFTLLRLDQAVPGEVKITVEGLKQELRVYRHNGLPMAFIGFAPTAKPGAYSYTVSWDGGAVSGKIQVVKKSFPVDRIGGPQDDGPYSSIRHDTEWKNAFPLPSPSHPEPLWRGAFTLPLEGDPKVTTYFGQIRIVDGTETGRHSGIDFAAATGSPILAPADGRVVLAEPLPVSGRTIVIDHGLNLFTAYFHCDSIRVKPGDQVKRTQVIGTVGSTGFSTGPHLHWTALVGDMPVNPWALLDAPLLGLEDESRSSPR